MTEPLTDFSRLSLNQYTTRHWRVKEAVEGCARAGIPAVGLWRDVVAETGLHKSASIARDAGIKVSSLCRGGMFPAATESERKARIEDNLQAIDEAAALGTEVLVLVCGGMPNRDLDAARQMVEDGIRAVIPHAEASGVKLGIEPLHPMFGADRSVIVTLGQANDLVQRIGSAQVGVIVDVYHVWWDPNVYDEIALAAGTILGFHVNDWLSPPPDVLLGRGMMGDGVIELRRLRAAVEAAGYDDFIEVEIFNDAIWNAPYDDVLELMKVRYVEYV